MTTFREIDLRSAYRILCVSVYQFVSHSGFRGRTLMLIVTVPKFSTDILYRISMF